MYGLRSERPQADSLAVRLAALGHSVPSVSADHSTATAFAEAWQRHTGATPKLVGEDVSIDADSWAGTRFADKRYTLWESPDGTPVSIAGMNPLIGGQIQVDIVCTPAHLRGRGYAGAVTAEVSRAALAAGARDVVLFADQSNPTSNALYQRLGYRTLTDWAAYDSS